VSQTWSPLPYRLWAEVLGAGWLPGPQAPSPQAKVNFELAVPVIVSGTP
jgi:hypothetical protein